MMQSTHRLLAVLLFTLGCGTTSTETHTTTAPSSAPLTATLSIDGPEPAPSTAALSLRAELSNAGPDAWTMPIDVLSVAQLSVEVHDASGHRMPSLPPPMPSEEPLEETLAPGTSRTFVVPLGVFSPDLPPGTYTVTWGVREGIQAAPVTFTIAP